MQLFFRIFGGHAVVVAFESNSRLVATQVVPTDWSGPTEAQLRTLSRPSYLRKREGGPFGPEVFAPAN